MMPQIKVIQRLSDWEPALKKDREKNVAIIKRLDAEEKYSREKRDEQQREADKSAKKIRMAHETLRTKPKIQAHREQRRKIIASRKEY